MKSANVSKDTHSISHTKNQRGRIVYSNHVHSDSTYFPFRRSGKERVVLLSGANYMSGKEELDQEIPLPPEIEEWGKCAETRYDDQISEDQQEIEPVHSEKGNIEGDDTPVESQIVGYNAAQDQYALRSAGEIK